MPTEPRPSEGAGLELGIVRTISPAHGGADGRQARPAGERSSWGCPSNPTAPVHPDLPVGGTRLLTRHQAPHPDLDELDLDTSDTGTLSWQVELERVDSSPVVITRDARAGAVVTTPDV